jgi:hypothetical protein
MLQRFAQVRLDQFMPPPEVDKPDDAGRVPVREV